MSTFGTLPVLLISAATEDVAASVITELIDNDVTEEYNKDIQSSDRVWRLVNKYYSADVRVHVLTDTGKLSLDPQSVEAHIIHITNAEVQGGEAAACARVAASGGAWPRAHVRVLLADGARRPAALAGLARAHRALLVARAPAADATDSDSDEDAHGEERGVAGARAALHAHTWRGLTRLRGSEPPAPQWEGDSEGEGAGEGEDEWGDEGGREWEALGEALRARPSLDEPRALRLARAERLLAALRLHH